VPGLRRFSVRNTRVFSCARPTKSTPSPHGEPGQVLLRQVVLALPLREVHHSHLVLPAEPVDRGDEALGHRVHQRRGGERRPAVTTEEPDHPVHMLQTRLIDVEVHAVDRLDLQAHVPGQDICDAARYRHRQLRSPGRPTTANHPPSGFNDGEHAPRVIRDRSL